MSFRILLVIAVGVCLRAANIPGPGVFSNQVVLCDTNNTHCSQLFAAPVNSTSYNNSFSVGGNPFNVSASDLVGFGVLSALAHFDTTVAQSFYTQFQIGAIVVDDLTFLGGTVGTIGYVAPSMTVTGTSTGAANASVNFIYQDSSDGIVHAQNSQYTIGNAIVTADRIPFHYGSPIAIYLVLGAITYAGGPGNLSATSDFSHTAILSGLPVFASSAGGNPLANINITSASGTSYTTGAGLVPEPSSYVLAGAGLMLLLIGGKRLRFTWEM